MKNKSNYARFQTSAAVYLRPSLFWDVTRRKLVIQEQLLGCMTFKLGLIRCPEPSVTTYHPTLRNIPEVRRLQQQLLGEVIKIVSYLIDQPLNSWLFAQFSIEISRDYMQLQFHNEVLCV